jgi:hypothetical protein
MYKVEKVYQENFMPLPCGPYKYFELVLKLYSDTISKLGAE